MVVEFQGIYGIYIEIYIFIIHIYILIYIWKRNHLLYVLMFASQIKPIFVDMFHSFGVIG